MRVQLAQQAKTILGQSDLVMITERVDDVALLIGQMVKMGFVEVLDRHLPRHWKQRQLSWGWTAVIWLAYILTEGDHRKVTVAAYIKDMQHTLSYLSGQRIEPLDFSDDRLGQTPPTDPGSSALLVKQRWPLSSGAKREGCGYLHDHHCAPS